MRDAAFHTLIASIGSALAADRALGGLCDWVEANVPRPVVGADRTMAQYNMAVFEVMPLLIAAGSLLIVVLYGPGMRAALITAIDVLCLAMLIDSNTSVRIGACKGRPLQANFTS